MAAPRDNALGSVLQLLAQAANNQTTAPPHYYTSTRTEQTMDQNKARLGDCLPVSRALPPILAIHHPLQVDDMWLMVLAIYDHQVWLRMDPRVKPLTNRQPKSRLKSLDDPVWGPSGHKRH